MKKKKTTLIICIFIIFFLLLSVLGLYHCPLRYFFGLSCPTCGITRAIVSAFKLDFSKAFHFHLFWPVLVIGFIIYGLNGFKIIHIKEKTMFLMAYIFAFLNLGYYFYRLFSGSEIVYFDFTESLIYKIIHML